MNKNELDFSISSNQNKLLSLISSDFEAFSEKDLTSLSNTLMSTWAPTPSEFRDFIFSIDHFFELNGGPAAKSRFSVFENDVKTLFSKAKESNILSEIGMLIQGHNYSSLADHLFSESGEEIDYVTTLLRNNKFYLPDLSGTISQGEWNYAHQCASFSAFHGLSRDFIAQLMEQHQQHQNSFSLVVRIKALIESEIDKHFDFSKIGLV